MLMWLYIMDFCTGGLYKKEITDEDLRELNLNEIKFLDSLGFKQTQVSYMIADNNIETIEEL